MNNSRSDTLRQEPNLSYDQNVNSSILAHCDSWIDFWLPQSQYCAFFVLSRRNSMTSSLAQWLVLTKSYYTPSSAGSSRKSD